MPCGREAWISASVTDEYAKWSSEPWPSTMTHSAFSSACSVSHSTVPWRKSAATRSMAQTAKVLAENPLLVRLKELETYKDLAAKVGQVHLVLGDNALHKLELKI